MALRIIACVLLLCLAPFSLAGFAVDCSKFSDWKTSECNKIIGDGSLNAEQKQELYLNLLESQGELGSFDFTWNWNNELQWNSPPIGAELKSDGIIRNAWLKIVGANKSYFDLNNSEWFVKPSGDLLCAYSYSIQLPSGTMPGDCQTTYSYQSANEDLAASLNGSSIGSQKISHYSTGTANLSPMEFSAGLLVRTVLTINHYRAHEHCRNPRDRRTCTTTCLYAGSEQRIDSVNLSDIFSAKAKTQEIELKTFLERNPGISRLTIKLDSGEPINGFKINSTGNNFSLSESNFDLAFTEDGIIYVTKSYDEEKNHGNFAVLDFNKSGGERKIVLGTNKPEDYSCILYFDFGEESGCSLIELQDVNLGVETDANHFDLKDAPNITIKLSDADGTALPERKVLLRSGQNTKELITGVDGSATTNISAEESGGIVSAVFEGDDGFEPVESSIRFPVGNKGSWDLGSQVLGFFSAYYFLFLIAKKVALGGF